MIIITVLGTVFFVAVGYFAFNFSQCIGTFTRLGKIIPTKIFGVVDDPFQKRDARKPPLETFFDKQKYRTFDL